MRSLVSEPMKKAAIPASAILVCAAGLHSWPVADVSAARFLWPANLVLLLWTAWLLVCLRSRGARDLLSLILPPACVWAYLAAAILSLAAAADLGRSVSTIAKSALCLVGTYTLISAAGLGSTRRAILMYALAATAGIAVLHAVVQLVGGGVPVALFESPLKFGSFLAMTVPCAASYLAAQDRLLPRFAAASLLLGALLVCTSAWAWLGIVVGLVAGAVAAPRLRSWMAVAFIVAALAIHFGSTRGIGHGLIGDFQYREDSGCDVRQRYLEWQALINLMKDRSAAGTGAGCLNDRRSEYYLRLPKNNTLAAFDQDGWLAASAEAGLPGLIALCWMFGRYLRRGWRRRHDPVTRAAWAGVAAGALAQIGSSLTYNGILVVLAILLALVDHGKEHVANASP